MIQKVARKVYHVLFKRGGAVATSAEDQERQAFEELTKKTAPSVFGARIDFPELQKPFKHSSTGIPVGDHTALSTLYTGQKIFVDVRDLSLAPHIMVDGLWEAHVTRALATLLQEDDVFFDIGANVGYYTCVAATRFARNRDGVVMHVFEPNPDMVKLIHKTLSVNGLQNMTQVNAIGVSDKPGQLTLHRDNQLMGNASFHKIKKGDAGDIKVPVTTVDVYCKDNKVDKVDVIKLDVEGFEDHAYAGMQQTIQRNPNLKIVMEFTFDAYENEPDFFGQLQNDFAFMYYIDPAGEFELITTFAALRAKTKAELVMIVLTNKEIA